MVSILIIGLALFVLFMAWAICACIVAGRADEDMEQAMSRWLGEVEEDGA